jgi:hypothetical protein
LRLIIFIASVPHKKLTNELAKTLFSLIFAIWFGSALLTLTGSHTSAALDGTSMPHKKL